MTCWRILNVYLNTNQKRKARKIKNLHKIALNIRSVQYTFATCNKIYTHNNYKVEHQFLGVNISNKILRNLLSGYEIKSGVDIGSIAWCLLIKK